ncbi:TPA: hypothetical protein ACYLIB_005652 [Burkholderia cenocepacia]|uniref:hypothetical protein n=1 Tax=Burkholderia cenocepacia TaxID=95486 RepID=UPI001B924FBC|nr:hypothetical protein [Burkholderia cenocepacia]MBR8434784.1 hypothetical protein [Burkholderia cenocepacia]
MNKTLTAAERATIMDACQSISRSADALKDCHTVDGDWGDDLDAKAFYDAELNLLARLTALLAAHPGQPEPRASASVIAAAIAVIKAARAHVLTDEHIDALDIAIKIQQGMFKVPEPRDEVTDEQIADMFERVTGYSLENGRAALNDADILGFARELLEAARAGDEHADQA